MTEKSNLDSSPSPQEEEDRINAGIAADPDARVLTDEEWEEVRLYRDAHPDEGPPRPAPELLERARRNDPELARFLEKAERRADEWERVRKLKTADAMPRVRVTQR